MKLAAIFLFFIGHPAFAIPLAVGEVVEKLEPLALKSDRPSVFKDKSETSVTLPSEKPRGDEKHEWIFSHVTAFHKDGKTVNQIALETENCMVSETLLDKTLMQQRVSNLIKSVSKQVFGEPFEIDGARYFKELGPHWKKTVHVSIRESHPGVRVMRITRGISKCDAREGFRFRFDFFL